MVCKNCNNTLTENSSFCDSCGERTTFKRLTVKSLILSFLNQFFSIDNKLFKTVKDLFVKPDIVIASYIDGFRKRYINVIPYLALIITLIGFQFFILKKFFPELLVVDMEINTGESPFSFQAITDAINKNQGLITIISIPIYALISRLVFIDKKKYNLAEHFVIITYASSQLYLLIFFVIFLTLPLGVSYFDISTYISIPMFFYMLLVYKRIYKLSFGNSFLRSLLYNTLSMIAVMVISVVGVILYFIITK